jgi:hypothetical protein
MNATDTVQAASWLEIVRQRADTMRFGHIDITIHEGRVTQVEATERTRLPLTPATSSEGQPSKARA